MTTNQKLGMVVCDRSANIGRRFSGIHWTDRLQSERPQEGGEELS